MSYWQRIGRDKLAVLCLTALGVIVLIGLFAPYLAPMDPNKTHLLDKYAGISNQHWLGADKLGRDLFSRLLYGIRTTVLLSLLTMGITLSLGSALGLIAGSCRGHVDALMMRLCDVALSFPSQVMILALVGMLGPAIHNVILATILVKWAWYTRMIRSAVIKYHQQQYVIYARMIGASPWFIVRRHLLPAVAADIIVLATLDVGWVILMISTLSFLGLGVQAPTAEWGIMLSEARAVMLQHPMQMIIPGLAIVTVVALFNLLGDCLCDALDVKERGQ